MRGEREGGRELGSERRERDGGREGREGWDGGGEGGWKGGRDIGKLGGREREGE